MSEWGTYPVLLVFTVLGLADADAVAVIAHRLVGLGPHWVSSLKSDVASHLRGHWSKSQVSRSTHLRVISWLATKWRNWQLQSASSRLRNWLSSMTWGVLLVTATSKVERNDGRGQQGLEQTAHAHELGLEVVEWLSGLACSRTHWRGSTANAHMASGSWSYKTKLQKLLDQPHLTERWLGGEVGDTYLELRWWAELAAWARGQSCRGSWGGLNSVFSWLLWCSGCLLFKCLIVCYSVSTRVSVCLRLYYLESIEQIKL